MLGWCQYNPVAVLLGQEIYIAHRLKNKQQTFDNCRNENRDDRKLKTVSVSKCDFLRCVSVNTDVVRFLQKLSFTWSGQVRRGGYWPYFEKSSHICDFLFTYYSSLSILLETRWPFLGDPVTYLNVATISSQIFDTRNKFSDIWRNKCTAVQRTLHLRVTSTSKTSIFKVHFFTTNISLKLLFPSSFLFLSFLKTIICLKLLFPFF